MPALRRHRVTASVAGAILLAVILSVLWMVLPLAGNMDHAVGHLALGVPAVLLLVLAAKTWPMLASGGAALVARNLLLLGLALFGGGLLIEAIGAFGYDADGDRASGLAVLHDVGVLIGPFGIVLTMAGAITSVGVALAARRGAAGSRNVTAAVIVAAVAAIAFVAGGILFGY